MRSATPSDGAGPQRERRARGDAKPVFARLTLDECNAVLRRNHVGRIAFINDGIVDIEPVHFVSANSWVFMRSADGTKLEAFARSIFGYPACVYGLLMYAAIAAIASAALWNGRHRVKPAASY